MHTQTIRHTLWRSCRIVSVAALFLLQAHAVPSQQRRADLLAEEYYREVDPDLLRKAAEKGIYSYAQYPVLRNGVNPYFIRGDFNGDSAMDVAVWVTNAANRLVGVAVIHSTLDSVRFLGAGHGTPREVASEAWHVLPPGTQLAAVRQSVPEIGAVDGRPYTFQREVLSFVYYGRSSFVYYWSNGRYWRIGTGD